MGLAGKGTRFSGGHHSRSPHRRAVGVLGTRPHALGEDGIGNRHAAQGGLAHSTLAEVDDSGRVHNNLGHMGAAAFFAHRSSHRHEEDSLAIETLCSTVHVEQAKAPGRSAEVRDSRSRRGAAAAAAHIRFRRMVDGPDRQMGGRNHRSGHALEAEIREVVATGHLYEEGADTGGEGTLLPCCAGEADTGPAVILARLVSDSPGFDRVPSYSQP